MSEDGERKPSVGTLVAADILTETAVALLGEEEPTFEGERER
jgi:hypothetical protein